MDYSLDKIDHRQRIYHQTKDVSCGMEPEMEVSASWELMRSLFLSALRVSKKPVFKVTLKRIEAQDWV